MATRELVVCDECGEELDSIDLRCAHDEEVCDDCCAAHHEDEDEEAEEMTRQISVTTAKQALDLIDQMLVELPPREGRALMAVLTALRGPDDQDTNPAMARVKAYGTCPVRAAAFPKARAARKLGMFDTTPNPYVKAEVAKGNGHQRQHLNDAAMVLGLY